MLSIRIHPFVFQKPLSGTYLMHRNESRNKNMDLRKIMGEAFQIYLRFDGVQRGRNILVHSTVARYVSFLRKDCRFFVRVWHSNLIAYSLYFVKSFSKRNSSLSFSEAKYKVTDFFLTTTDEALYFSFAFSKEGT